MYVTNKPATAIIIVLAAFLIATLALACSSATPRAGDVNTDRAALAALYNATNGSSWLVNTNWLSNGPLGEWHGVSTDADGRVAELDLDGKQLSGPIPSELGNLANLEFLSLRDKQLSGSIPSELGNLDNLQSLRSVAGSQTLAIRGSLRRWPRAGLRPLPHRCPYPGAPAHRAAVGRTGRPA